MLEQIRKPKSYRSGLYRRAIIDSFRKLAPWSMVRNPVMFIVEIGGLLASLLWVQAFSGQGEAPVAFIGAIALWLWFTVLFANFSEALAEGRGKAQAEALRKTRQDTPAKKLHHAERNAGYELVSSTRMREGDHFLVETGDILPADG